MEFAFRKASLCKKALIFLHFKAPKPSKLPIAQTVEGSMLHLIKLLFIMNAMKNGYYNTSKLKGTAVHCRFRNYHKYTKYSHTLCNDHILGELTGITELQGQNWAKPMKNLLIEIKK